MARNWQGRSHGGSRGHALVRWFAQTCGATPAYLFVLPPCLWFYFRDHAARRASQDYWRRLRPELGRWGRHVHSVRQFYDFARALTDRLLVGLAPRALSYSFPNTLAIQDIMAQGPSLIISAHHGNWELAGHWLARINDPRLRINIVMYLGEDPAIRAQVERAMGANPLPIIDLGQGLEASLAMMAALQRGECCCLLADRQMERGQGGEAVPFLGAAAEFPAGIMAAAIATRAAVIPIFCLRSSWRRYRILAPQVWYPRSTPGTGRRQLRRQWVQRWADLLATVVRRTPHQWHNFYPFWRRN